MHAVLRNAFRASVNRLKRDQSRVIGLVVIQKERRRRRGRDAFASLVPAGAVKRLACHRSHGSTFLKPSARAASSQRVFQCSVISFDRNSSNTCLEMSSCMAKIAVPPRASEDVLL